MGAKTLYKVFSVAERNTILPPGDGWSQFLDRVTCNRIVEVIDTNENGKPDSGDTGVDRWGDIVPDIQFDRELVYYDSDITSLVTPGYTFGPGYAGFRIDDIEFPDGMNVFEADAKTGLYDGIFVAKRAGFPNHVAIPRYAESPPIEGRGLPYSVEHVDEASVERLAIDVAAGLGDYSESQWEQAKEFGRSISDNPYVVGGIAGAAFLVGLHPKGRALLAGIGSLGAVYGTAGFTADKVVSIASGTPAGQHDFEYLLWALGGVSAFKGYRLGNFAEETMQVVRAAQAWMNGAVSTFRFPMLPPPAAAVVGGGTMAAPIDAAVALAPSLGTLGVPGFSSWLGAFGPLRMVAELQGGLRDVSINEAFRPDPEGPVDLSPTWEGSEAENAARFIVDEMRALDSLFEGKYSAELETLESNVRALAEIYEGVPSSRKAISEWFRELGRIMRDPEYKGLDAVDITEVPAQIKNRVVSILSETVRDNLVFLRVTRVRTSIMPPPPPGIDVVPEAVRTIEKRIPRELVRSIIRDAWDKLARHARGEIRVDQKVIKKTSEADIYEYRNNDGPGWRVYFGWLNEGRLTVLRGGPKGSPTEQTQDIKLAKKLFDSLKAKL